MINWKFKNNSSQGHLKRKKEEDLQVMDIPFPSPTTNLHFISFTYWTISYYGILTKRSLKKEVCVNIPILISIYLLHKVVQKSHLQHHREKGVFFLQKTLLRAPFMSLFLRLQMKGFSMGVTTVYIIAITVSLTVELLADGHKQRPITVP